MKRAIPTVALSAPEKERLDAEARQLAEVLQALRKKYGNFPNKMAKANV